MQPASGSTAPRLVGKGLSHDDEALTTPALNHRFHNTDGLLRNQWCGECSQRLFVFMMGSLLPVLLLRLCEQNVLKLGGGQHLYLVRVWQPCELSCSTPCCLLVRSHWLTQLRVQCRDEALFGAAHLDTVSPLASMVHATTLAGS